MIVSVYLPDPLGELVAVEADAHPLQPGVQRLTRGTWIARHVARVIEEESLAARVLGALAEVDGARSVEVVAEVVGADPALVRRTLEALADSSPAWPARVARDAEGRFHLA